MGCLVLVIALGFNTCCLMYLHCTDEETETLRQLVQGDTASCDDSSLSSSKALAFMP